jgi:uncharacterized protein (TIGR02646 family)
VLYVRKTQPPPDLLAFIDDEKRKGVFHPEYSDLQNISYSSLSQAAYNRLKEQLCYEQRGLCCYCMKVITKDNSTIEHFLPQSIFPEGHVDYYNLYLACRYSHGRREEHQHCDIRKGDSLITKFIGVCRADGEKCEDFFQYTHDGYILPKHKTFKLPAEFYKNFKHLDLMSKGILLAIETLNLNVSDLKRDRESFTLRLLTKINEANIPQLQYMKRYYEQEHSKSFAGVAIYFLKQKLERLSASRSIV